MGWHIEGKQVMVHSMNAGCSTGNAWIWQVWIKCTLEFGKNGLSYGRDGWMEQIDVDVYE